MSDGITEARRGTYFKDDKYDKSIINWDLHQKIMEQKNNKPQTITICTGVGLNMFFPEYTTIEITPETENK
jgi:hypothetical protein